MTRHKHADVLIAIAEGKTVQLNTNESISLWIDYIEGTHFSPLSDFGQNFIWRVKPEPKPDLVKFYTAEYNLAQDFVSIDLAQSKPNVRFIFDGETGALKDADVVHYG